jgi:ribonucleotide monophosphatase NagD (HAD superfamily)
MVDIKRRPRPSQSILKAHIEDSISKGESANKSLERLQNLGYGLRRQEFLRAFRDIANLPKKKDEFISTPTNKIFGSKNYRINENKVKGFLTVFKVEFVNKQGDRAVGFVAVKHDKPLKKSELVAKVKQYAKNYYIINNDVTYDEYMHYKDEYRVTDADIIRLEDAYKGWLED